MNKYKIITLSIALLALPLFFSVAYGQAPPPPPPPPATGVPFGAIELLLGALGVYAVKKFKNSKEES